MIRNACRLLFLLALTSLVGVEPASTQSSMSLSCSRYGTSCSVGLSVSWAPVSGASYYQVQFHRQDACGSATTTTTTSGTSAGSGTYTSCNPNACYSFSASVQALSSQDVVLATGSCGSYCWMTYTTGETRERSSGECCTHKPGSLILLERKLCNGQWQITGDKCQGICPWVE